MRVPRIHVPTPLRDGARIRLPDTAARHVRSALRLRDGAPVVLFDGAGGCRDAVLTRVAHDGVEALAGAARDGGCEAPLAVTLALGVARGERMDLAIQKAVELGAAAIVPLVTERSVVRLAGERAERRRVHWQAVAIAACEQCGRNHVPPVDAPTSFGEWLATLSGEGLRLMPDPAADTGLASIEREPGSPVTLLIGPEGGLGDAERTFARERGFRTVRLGPRVMRTETAVIASLAAVMTLWGDLGRA